MTDSKMKFRTGSYAMLKKSINRLNVFIESEMDQFITRELLIMLDRVHTMNPDEYASAIKTYKLGSLKRERGLCSEYECYNTLAPPLEALKMQAKDQELARCMEWYCPAHAVEQAKNQDTDDNDEEN